MTSHSGTGEDLTEPPSASADTPTLDAPLVKAAFGAANRNRLIQEYLSSSDDEPWKAVYKLILWIDKTTGLAHCYESDKTQPGKNWHVRSLRFHEWLAKECAQSPATVGESIDWLFRHVADDYARYMVKQYQRLLDKAVTQRASFSGGSCRAAAGRLLLLLQLFRQAVPVQSVRRR